MSRAAFGAVLAGGLLIGLILWGGWTLWQKGRTESTRAEVSQGQAGAAIESGRDAVGAIGAAGAREVIIDVRSREFADAIRTMPGAQAPVDPALRDAALAGLCRHDIYQRDPRCVQLAPAP